MNKTVAIIVPVYNVETYLRECLDSIVAQTYRNIKAYLVNDGSTDKSDIILDEYKDKYPDMFCIITQQNSGISAARNAGLAAVNTEEYVTFIDSDDYIQPNYIERLLTVAQDSDADIVQANYYELYEDGTIINKITNEGNYVISQYPDIICDLTTSVWNKLYKTYLFNDSTLHFPTNIYYGLEDLAVTYRIAARSDKIAFISDTLYMYRMRAGGISKKTVNYADKAQTYISVANLQLADQYREKYPEQLDYIAIEAYKSSIFCYIDAKTPTKKIKEDIYSLDEVLPQWQQNRILRNKTKKESRRMRLWIKLFTHKQVVLLKLLYLANTKMRSIWS